MSRVPRFQEHLKTGFTAEATKAARFRAYADRAEREGLPSLAGQWRRLAEEKDALAIAQLEAAGQVRGQEADIVNAISEERYENDVLFPKMIRDVAGTAATDTLTRVAEEQKRHLAELEELRRQVLASTGDVGAPAAVASAAR